MLNPNLLDEVTTQQQGVPAISPEEHYEGDYLPWSVVGQFPEVFDSTMLASAKACFEQFRKSHIQHWRPKSSSVHLHAGGAFARGLEVTRRCFYEHRESEEDSIAKGLQALLHAYGNYDCPPDSAKSAERMAGAFEFYFQNYPLSWDDGYPVELPGGKRGIEFSFAHPLPVTHPTTGNPILYVGRMDAIIAFAGGAYICDEKTTTQLGASWPRQWDLRSQFTGYTWGCQQSGIEVTGAIVRGISILKTKYDTAQSISARPEFQVQRWYNELLEWIEDLKINWQRRGPDAQWRHNLDHSCAEYGGCQFREACLAQDEQPWLETVFERRVWDPVLRVEKRVLPPP